MMWWLRPLFITIFLSTLPGCFWHQSPKLQRMLILKNKPVKATVAPHTQPYPITIWIHGTRLLPSGVLETFFYSKPGLHHYTEIDSIYKQYKIAEDIITSAPDYFVAQGFYLFGWSGNLSFEERKTASRLLYSDLRKLRETYEKQFGQEPLIRIVTHSHGGNVALNLAGVQDPDDISFVIEELILLACPVQLKTSAYIEDFLFKKIYSLYSALDMVQIMDPQGLYSSYRPRTMPVFSERCFKPCERLEQIQINLDQHAAFHIDFIRHNFLVNLGSILDDIKQWQKEAVEKECSWEESIKILHLYTTPPKRKRSAYL